MKGRAVIVVFGALNKMFNNIATKFNSYTAKIGGGDSLKKPPRAEQHETAKSLVGSFLGVLAISTLDEFWLRRDFEHSFLLIGSIGAAAVLLFSAYKSPLAQPWNAVAGQVVSATVGVTVRLVCSDVLSIEEYLQKPLAVSLAIAAMDLCDCLHPPGGATSLIAIIGGADVKAMGYSYVWCVGE